VKRALALALALSALGVYGCGERDQVVEQQSEKRYQGKHDANPWDNAPLAQEYRGGTWNKGDERGWEEQIKQRQMAQHEDRRIYQ
jgi:hypothetical protein